MRNGVETFQRAFPTARFMWDADVENVGRLEAFWLGKTLVLILDRANGDGWEVFTPTTDDGNIDATLAAIAVRSGVEQTQAVTNIVRTLQEGDTITP